MYNTLAIFLFLAVVKDVLCSLATNKAKKQEIRRKRSKDNCDSYCDSCTGPVIARYTYKMRIILTMSDLWFKTVKLCLSFMLEDGVQMFLQYFYHERYNKTNTFVFFNAIFKFGLMIYYLLPTGKVF